MRGVWDIDWGEGYPVNENVVELAVVFGFREDTADSIEEFVARGYRRVCLKLVRWLAPDQNLRRSKPYY
jgi:hypothetical protein